MTDILATQQNFRALSVKDLLQARDLYHYHLLNKPNVVGTAIGLYLIRKSDMSPSEERAYCRRTGAEPVKGERTLQNSTVRDYSWPCVLAFVREWLNASEFGARYKPEEMIPRTLYMPDGRMVPVCVVKVEQGEPMTDRLVDWHWPRRLFGGGMPIIVDAQKQTHQATSGCLVSDGHTTYALTSRHVCGNQGEPVFTLARGERVEIGRASARHLTRLPFTEIYPEFVGHRTYVNLDVGLIQLADLNQWTSQTFGLGPMGALADLNELNISTRLINAPVVAYGAASGRLEGRIKALFEAVPCGSAELPRPGDRLVNTFCALRVEPLGLEVGRVAAQASRSKGRIEMAEAATGGAAKAVPWRSIANAAAEIPDPLSI